MPSFPGKATSTAAVVLTGLSLSACGTIFGGSAQEIHLSSRPPEAVVEFDRVNRTVTTPTEIELKRKHTYELTFTKEGYSTETSVVESSLRWEILVLDVLFTGLVGVAIDAGTGAWNQLDPENVRVTLQKQAASTPGPDRILVRLSVSESGEDATALDVRAGEPVQVRIRRLE